MSMVLYVIFRYRSVKRRLCVCASVLEFNPPPLDLSFPCIHHTPCSDVAACKRRLFGTTVFWLSQLERALIRERVMAGLHAAHKKGR